MSQEPQDTEWFGPDAATFGDRVAASREAAQMTQSQLARRLGVRLATLRAWENDLSEPRANRLATLAGMLNVSMMWLINGEGEGLETPDQQTALSADAEELLSELGKLRREMIENTRKLAVLEKRLRLTLKETSDA